MNKRILVTGGAGFIGSTLVRKLIDRDFQVTVLDDLSTGLPENLPLNKNVKLLKGDVRDFDLISKLTKKNQYVLHLAAHAFIPLSYEMPLQVAEVNAMGSINVLKACKDYRIKRLVHISSSEVYGPAQHEPMDEKHPIQPYSTYSVAKAAADMWAQTFFFEHNLPVVILRPFNTYGPRESLPYFVPEMIRQCLKEPVIQVGNLETKRDFTYVEDTTEAMAKAVETKDIEGQIINIGSNQTHTMKDILALIKKLTNTENKPVVVDKSRLRPRDVHTLITDNKKAKQLLEWQPKTAFEEGIRQTVGWYAHNGQTWGYEKHVWKWRY
jgi:dTDP-glucose 4,6-dehydratase